ncbi:MAG: aminopeptidase N C-terminal domain-containing protein, partial [Mangrovicoccus sp.]
TPSRGHRHGVAVDIDAQTKEPAMHRCRRLDELAWSLAKDSLIGTITEGSEPDAAYLEGLARLLEDESLDPAFRALCLGLPSQDDLAQSLFDSGVTPDPLAIYEALHSTREVMAEQFEPLMAALYDRHQVPGAYDPSAEAAGKRALTGAALGLLTRRDGGARAKAQWQAADNMTLKLGALAALLLIEQGEAELASFYDDWKADRLVLDKWFALQVSSAKPAHAVATAQRLAAHPDFTWKTPNRFRAVVGALAMNPAGFHEASGAGYEFVADWLITLDAKNPQTTARISTVFETWRRYDADRQALMIAALRRIKATENLSRDTTEMVTRLLGDAA